MRGRDGRRALHDKVKAGETGRGDRRCRRGTTHRDGNHRRRNDGKWEKENVLKVTGRRGTQ